MKTPHQTGKEPRNILGISTLLFFVVFLFLSSNVAAPMPPYPIFIFAEDINGLLNTTDIYCTTTNLNTTEYLTKHCYNDLNYSVCQFNLAEPTEFPSLYSDADKIIVNCSNTADHLFVYNFSADEAGGVEVINESLINYGLYFTNATFNRTAGNLSLNWALNNETGLDNIYLRQSMNYADNFSTINISFAKDVRSVTLNVSGSNNTFFKLCMNFTNSHEFCYTDKYAAWENKTLECGSSESGWALLNNFLTLDYTNMTANELCDYIPGVLTVYSGTNPTNLNSAIYCPWRQYFNTLPLSDGFGLWILSSGDNLSFTNAGLTTQSQNLSLIGGTYFTLAHTDPTENRTQSNFCSGITGGGTKTLYTQVDGVYGFGYVCGVDVPTFNLSIDTAFDFINTESVNLTI